MYKRQQSHERMCNLPHEHLVPLEHQVYTGDPEHLRMFYEHWYDNGPRRTITETDIRTFGALTANEQWIHTDAKRAAQESPYGGLIAHAVLLVGLIPSLMPVEDFILEGYQQRIVRGFDTLRFPGPIYPDEQVFLATQLCSAWHAPSGKGLVLTRELHLAADGRAHEPALTGILHYQYF